MEWNPFFSGALNAFIYVITFHLLPRKLNNWKKGIVAILISVPVMLLIRFIFDCFYM